MTFPFDPFRPLSLANAPWADTHGLTTEQRLKREVDDLRNRLASIDGQPFVLGTVTALATKNGKAHATISLGTQIIQREVPSWAKDIRIGLCVRCIPPNLFPVEFCEHPPARASIVEVVRVHDNGMVEFATMGQANQIIACGFPCKAGDRVVVDPSGNCAIRNLGRGASTGKSTWTGTTGVEWEDIGGLEDAKRLMIEAIEEPALYATIYARFGKKPCRGILLLGPSGTGKTMLGKAAASAMARMLDKASTPSGFLYSKGPELLGQIVGSSEANVRNLFAAAREHKEEHGYPAIIFLDEVDAIVGHRGSGQRAAGDGMGKVSDSVTMQFLAEMDGLDDASAIVIATTNRPSAIDPAALRAGRFDRKIEIGRPDEKGCALIFAKALRGRPLEHELPAFAELAASELFAPKHVLRMSRPNAPATSSLALPPGTPERVTLGSVATGALVADVVEKATAIAIRRAITGTDDAIRMADIRDAIAEVVGEEKAIGAS